MKYTNWLAGTRHWLAGSRVTYADLAAAATLSVLDYLGEIDWREHAAAREWYTRVKSRPSFRPLLTDRVRGLSPVSHYADSISDASKPARADRRGGRIAPASTPSPSPPDAIPLAPPPGPNSSPTVLRLDGLDRRDAGKAQRPFDALARCALDLVLAMNYGPDQDPRICGEARHGAPSRSRRTATITR